MANNSKLVDTNLIRQAGFDPKTGLPLKMSGALSCALKESIKHNLRVIDEQDAVNRYKWYNLPAGITSQELERLLYYRGQLAFFYIPDTDSFYFMPYALDGTIDFYGRFNRIHPVPMAEGTSEEEKKRFNQQRAYLSTLKLNVEYDVALPDDDVIDKMKNSCVLLHDYTKQLNQIITPRSQLQDCIIDVMADCIPFMHTALLNSTGVLGMRVGNPNESQAVIALSEFINKAALSGNKYVPIVGNIDFQELTGGDVAKSEEFLLAMQALDNFRLSTYGIENGGLFEKKAHTLESEQAMNTGNTGIVYNDGLSIRQNFCDIVNSIWGPILDDLIWCEATEQAMGVDTSGDGIVMDEEDQSGSMQGQQPEQIREEE